MEEQRFDALAKTVGDGAGSRRRALQAMGAALASAGLLSRVSGEADAGSAKTRCKQKHGVYLAQGECHCAWTNPAYEDAFPCNGNATCRCMKAATGRGFCAQPDGINSDGCVCNGCPAGKMCVVDPGVFGYGQPCTTTMECRNMGLTLADCINGRCESTTCQDPCP
jgi:hypothetical protein